LLEETWKEIYAGLEVKLCQAPEGQEVFILCRSAERRLKEQAIHARFEERIEQKLEQMAASCRPRKQDPLLLAATIRQGFGTQ